MRVIGLLGIALGLYAFLSVIFPKIRTKNWRPHPASVLLLIGCLAVLLGLSCLGIARPYTLIAAFVVCVFGYVIERKISNAPDRRAKMFVNRNEAVIALLLFVSITAVAIWIVLRSHAKP